MRSLASMADGVSHDHGLVLRDLEGEHFTRRMRGRMLLRSIQSVWTVTLSMASKVTGAPLWRTSREILIRLSPFPV
jgi:hypothetical protein